MDPRVTVSLVTWNSARFLGPCLNSLHAQRGVALSLLVVDNASIDGTVERVRELSPHATVIRNPRNAGFGRAHNQALLLSSTRYALILNPDTVVEPDAVARLVAALEGDARIGAVGPKLRRYALGDPNQRDPVRRTTTLDSAGIVRTRSGAFLDRGANQTDTGQFDRPDDVFALSGACLLLRRAALESIRVDREFFDQDFFAYKEDVDLCWRLRRHQWRCRYEPGALVYHRRALSRPRSPSDPAAVRAERRRTVQRVRTLSYRNHWLTYVRNGSWREAVSDYPLRWAFELAKVVFLLIVEPRTLAGAFQALRLAPRIRAKRRRERVNH